MFFRGLSSGTSLLRLYSFHPSSSFAVFTKHSRTGEVPLNINANQFSSQYRNTNCQLQIIQHVHSPPSLLSPMCQRSFSLSPSLMVVQNKNTENSTDSNTSIESTEVEEKQDEDLTLFQRFKKAYKVYGKLMVVIHVTTSCIWFGCFWYIVYSGLDVANLLSYLWIPEKVLALIRNKGVGTVAAAYVLYKLATPLRYTVTLYGTRWTAAKLRSTGRLPPIAEEDKLRNLAKESSEVAKRRLSRHAVKRK